MIFNNLMETEASNSITLDESFNLSTAVSLALIESAESDYRLFNAVLNCDCMELNAMKSGAVNESELSAIREASIQGLWKAVKGALEWLAKKIKEIFFALINKVSKIAVEDKLLAKKLAKVNFDKLKEIKYSTKLKTSTNSAFVAGDMKKFFDVFSVVSVDDAKKYADMDVEAIKTSILKELGVECKAGEEKECIKAAVIADVLDEKETEKNLSEFAYLKDVLKVYSEIVNSSKRVQKTLLESISKNIKNAEKRAKKEPTEEEKKADNFVDPAVVLKVLNASKAVQLLFAGAFIDSTTELLKASRTVAKAAVDAFDKLPKEGEEKKEEKKEEVKKESFELDFDLLREEVEQEVEDVISSAIKDDCPECGVQSVSAADTDVKPDDTSDDPNALIDKEVVKAEEERDTDDNKVEGSIDVDLNSKLKEAVENLTDVIVAAVKADPKVTQVQSVSTASVDVKPNDASDDPNALVDKEVAKTEEERECEEKKDENVDGVIDTELDSKVEESAIDFGAMFF